MRYVEDNLLNKCPFTSDSECHIIIYKYVPTISLQYQVTSILFF